MNSAQLLLFANGADQNFFLPRNKFTTTILTFSGPFNIGKLRAIWALVDKLGATIITIGAGMPFFFEIPFAFLADPIHVLSPFLFNFSPNDKMSRAP